MSSILEALERAEQERNLGEKKLFLATHAAPPRWLKYRIFWLTGGALLLLNLIVLWVLFRGNGASDAVSIVQAPSPAPRATALVAPQPQQPAVSLPVSPQRAQPSEAEVPVVKDQPEPVQEPALHTPPPAVAQPAEPQPAEPQPAEPQPAEPQPAEPAEPQPRVVETPAQAPPVKPLEREAQVTKKTLPPVAKAQPIAIQEPPPVVKEEPELPVEPAVQIEQSVAKTEPAPQNEVSKPSSPVVEAPAAVPVQETVEVSADAAAEQQVEAKQADILAQIPMAWEMPSSMQKKLAKLKVNIHVFNPEVSKRFVIINMKRYKEGDALELKGMSLDQITPKGVVIDYGDGLVRM